MRAPLLRNSLLGLCILLLALPVCASSPGQPTDEICRIRIQNVVGGLVQVSLNGGVNYSTVGRVTVIANARITGFAASSYMPRGTVAATAVHGLRIKTGQSAESGVGKAQMPLMFSIIPKEFATTPKGFGGHVSRSSGVHTDIPAGHSIFRNQSPYVGNPVFVERDHALQPLPEDYMPLRGETFVILVQKPVRMPSGIEFENRVGGSVTVTYPDSASEVIAHVVRPVEGVGRYDGTTFTGVGKVNTNHGGVLTISTAPTCAPGTREGGNVETRGGFMIQPYFHASEQGETKVQVMVVGPKDASKPSMEGTPPLFDGYINLSFYNGHLANSYRAQVRIDDGEWENVPQVIGKVDNAFLPEYLKSYFAKSGIDRRIEKGVTAVRLLFPEYDAKLMAEDLAREASQYAARAPGTGARTVSGVLTLAPSRRSPGVKMVNFYFDGHAIYRSNEFPYKHEWDSSLASNGYHGLEVETVFNYIREPLVESYRVFVKN